MPYLEVFWTPKYWTHVAANVIREKIASSYCQHLWTPWGILVVDFGFVSWIVCTMLGLPFHFGGNSIVT